MVWPLCVQCNVGVGSSTDLTAPKFDFGSSPESGLKSDIGPCPKSANSGSDLYGSSVWWEISRTTEQPAVVEEAGSAASRYVSPHPRYPISPPGSPEHP